MSSLQPARTLCELKSSKCKQTRVGSKKKRHACHSFDWGVCFLCHSSVFLKKMINIRFCVHIIYIYIYIVYTKHVYKANLYKAISESPYFLHPQSATAATAVYTSTAHREGRPNICSNMTFLTIVLNKYIT